MFGERGGNIGELVLKVRVEQVQAGANTWNLRAKLRSPVIFLSEPQAWEKNHLSEALSVNELPSQFQ